MNTKFLLSPAYLASVAAMLVGALLSGTHYMVIGWIVFVVGLGLNAMSLVVLANREKLHRAQGVGSVPVQHCVENSDATASSETSAADTPVARRGTITEDSRIFPQK